jgi:hypothetical protein
MHGTSACATDRGYLHFCPFDGTVKIIAHFDVLLDVLLQPTEIDELYREYRYRADCGTDEGRARSKVFVRACPTAWR